jgi:hypothetical protein
VTAKEKGERQVRIKTGSWASEAAYAGGTWSGVTVSAIKLCISEGCPPKDSVIIRLSAGATGTPPSCSSSYRNYIVIDTTTELGKFAAGIMQSARLLGTDITVVGTGSCSVDSAAETLASVTE